MPTCLHVVKSYDDVTASAHGPPGPTVSHTNLVDVAQSTAYDDPLHALTSDAESSAAKSAVQTSGLPSLSRFETNVVHPASE